MRCKCGNCGREHGIFEGWSLDGPSDDYHDNYHNLCSLDCVIERAWTLREAQPKLSKSKAPDEQTS